MAPTALFDKSFLQALNVDEAVLLDAFFLPVICPMFYVETLADLSKKPLIKPLKLCSDWAQTTTSFRS